jgi:hypothetical protein
MASCFVFSDWRRITTDTIVFHSVVSMLKAAFVPLRHTCSQRFGRQQKNQSPPVTADFLGQQLSDRKIRQLILGFSAPSHSLHLRSLPTRQNTPSSPFRSRPPIPQSLIRSSITISPRASAHVVPPVPSVDQPTTNVGGRQSIRSFPTRRTRVPCCHAKWVATAGRRSNWMLSVVGGLHAARP